MDHDLDHTERSSSFHSHHRCYLAPTVTRHYLERVNVIMLDEALAVGLPR